MKETPKKSPARWALARVLPIIEEEFHVEGSDVLSRSHFPEHRRARNWLYWLLYSLGLTQTEIARATERKTHSPVSNAIDNINLKIRMHATERERARILKEKLQAAGVRL